MTLAHAWFAERPRTELVRLDQLEIVSSPLSARSIPRAWWCSAFRRARGRSAARARSQETVFRLLVSVLEQTTVEQPWMPLTYFQLWMTRLMGLLPELGHCTACGEALRAGEASFNTLGDGLFCPLHRSGGASELSATPGNWRSVCCVRLLRPLLQKPGPAARSGPATLHAPGPGAAPGAQTALVRGAGAAGG